MSAEALFFGAHGRLRAPIRIAAFVLATLLAYALVATIAYPLVIHIADRAGLRPSLAGPMSVGALLMAHVAVLRWIERDRGWSFVWMGGQAAKLSPLLTGAALGALAIIVPSGLLLSVGWLRLEEIPDGSSLETAWRSALLLMPLAFSEELMIRGYPLAVLRESVGWPGALLITSAVFGLLHAGNPGVTVTSIIVVALAGIFLGAIVLVTQSLYAATIAHFAWNWVMAAVMHAPVSGISDFTPADYRIVDAGPDWITGGQWGPEGGIGAIAGMAAALWFIFRRPQGRALWQRPGRREEQQA